MEEEKKMRQNKNIDDDDDDKCCKCKQQACISFAIPAVVAAVFVLFCDYTVVITSPRDN